MLLSGGDRYEPGPVWFFAAHRGELELEIKRTLTLFGGAGRRDFRERGRSRIEVDGGLGGSLDLGERARLTGIVSARSHDAEKRSYDLRGGTALVSGEMRLPERWLLRAGMLLALDDYPHSKGYFDAASPGNKRRDVLVKLSASGFAPPFVEQLRLGLTYEYARRMSSANPYDYQDHRVLLKLVWAFSFDSWLPHAVSPDGHVALDYGLESTEVEERVQDLLRQDEAAQRSSSCVE